MKNIRDLHFEKEILPLFDFVYHEFSREALVGLLSEFQGSVEEILTRQEILRCLLETEKLYGSPAYSRSEFYEVYRYTEELKSRDIKLAGSHLKLHLLFVKSERTRESIQLSRLLHFFHQIRQAYFIHLKPGLYPAAFGDRLKNGHRFLSDLDLDKYIAITRRRKLTISETGLLLERLGEKTERGEIAVFWKDLFLLEAYLSIAQGIRKHGFVFPSFRPTGLALTDFYHPLLKEPVKNSLTVHKNVILITGPNMSGKSTLLKAIGLCVYLGHLGLAVPASACELSYFDEISIAINLNDDIQSGYSHFMTEIQTLKNVVVEAGRSKRCFAIFDELFRGTNAEDALVISATTILGLTKFSGSCFFISTHLHQLREAIAGQEDNIGLHYIECELTDERPVFTYRVQEGWSDLKIGQILFEQEGLNGLLRPLPLRG